MENGATLRLKMHLKVQLHQTHQGEQYFMYGPLVLAHAIEANQKVTKYYPVAGLKEMTYTPVVKSIYLYTGKPISKNENSNELLFNTNMQDLETGKNMTLELMPMGKTILRQTTFKKAD